MNIKEFEFPKPSLDLETDLALLDEAKKRGFYNGRTPYNKLFNEIFFMGGELNFKSGLEESFRIRCFPYLKAFMMSFRPKHEEKEAISALLLSELVRI